MAYGNGQRLGETIDPRLMQVDFGAIERAGATQGNMFAQMGQDIGGTIKKYGDDEKTIKKAQQMAKSISDAIPELAEMGNNALAELNNSELSQRDRLAIAEGIQDSLKLGILGLDRKDSAATRDWEKEKFNQSMGLERDELAMRIGVAQNTPLPAPSTEEFGLGDGKQKLVWDGRLGKYVNPESFVLDPSMTSTQDANAVQNGLPPTDPDGILMGDVTPIPGDGNFPDYGGIGEAMQAKGDERMVLPPKSSGLGFTRNNEAKQKPELVTLADGTKTYGSFDNNGMFHPARTQDGKPMTLTEGQTLTAKEAIDVEAKQKETAQTQSAAIAKSENFISLLNKLEAHPGFDNLFGTNITVADGWGVPTFMPGTESKDAKVLLKQIDAKGFMEAIKEMKGMGALSNAEGEKASSAFLGLDSGMSEKAAKAAIEDARAAIRLGIERAKSGNLLQTESNNPRAVNASRLRSLTPNPLQQ